MEVMRDTVSDRHRGKTFIIGGTAPSETRLPQEVFDRSIVIGVNNYPLIRPCRYWITCDTHRIPERMPDALAALPAGTETFFNEQCKRRGLPEPDHWFKRPTGPLTAHCQPIGNYRIPNRWRGRLQHIWTSATAAANLALIMGASEVILYKVDLTGKTLFANRRVPWAEFAPEVSNFFKRLEIPVYKTNRDSPLELPLWR